MQAYRVTLSLDVPSLTAWHADTLFGHLCWALVRREGEGALGEMLALCGAGRPPLLLSDGFPPDSFPRPLLAPVLPAQSGTLSVQIEKARQAKDARDRKWLTGAEFASLLNGKPLEEVAAKPQTAEEKLRDIEDEEESRERPFFTLHSQINRESGTTAGAEDDSGHLFAIAGELVPSRVFYLRVADDIAFDWRELLQDVALTGYGKRKSVGYGAISSCHIEPFAGFGEPADANGFVSLSAFVPAPSDPTEGSWRTEVKYGKLGEELANSDKPFKRPLLRLLAGATFRAPGPVRDFYGSLVTGIAPIDPAVVQYAYAFAVPIHLPARATE